MPDSIEKETTFAPGPYEDHNESSFAGGVSYRTIVAAARNDHVGNYWKTICLLPHFDDPQTVANARLFAAAPELYEALALITPEFVALLRHAESVAAIAEYSDNDREIVAKCQAALAKARGEDRSHEGK